MSYHFNKEKKYYEVSFRVVINGKRKQIHRRGFPTVKAAKDFEREFLHKNNNSIEMSFKSLYELYIEYISKRVKERYLIIKKSVFKNILPFFENCQLNEITPLIVSKWQNEMLGKGFKNNYLRNCNAQLKAIFTFADKFYDMKSPMKKLDPICSSEKKELNIWSVEDFNLFYNSLDKEIHKILFLLLFWTGARIGETLALTYKDIDFENSTININKSYWNGRVTTPKTKSSIRKIKISSNLKNELEVYTKKLYNLQNEDRLFPIGPLTLYTLLKRVQSLNLKKISVHDLRHSHASLLIGNGVNIVAVSKRLGHSDTSMTLNVYSHLLVDSEDKLIEKIETLE